MESKPVQLFCVALCLLVCCGMRLAAAARSESIAGGLGSSRKLLSCAIVKDPSYKPANGKALPLCATQYFPDISARGDTTKYSRVTLTTAEPISKANAADLAHAWTRDPVNPKTDSTLQCSGQVDQATKECWSGKAIEVDATFSSISCCSTGVTCFIKTGGCVM